MIFPAVKEALNTALHHKACSSVTKSIPLGNDTVQRRIDEMSAHVEHQLCNALRNTEFSIQLDESTLPGNESLLLGYVRFVHNGVLCEEFAIALSPNTDAQGRTVFQEVKTYFETNAIALTNVIACAIDGALSIMGYSVNSTLF